jgi:3-methyl-2-oxobutanoate hydroxymethyltransferase
MRTTLLDVHKMKAAGRRIPMLTAYDYAAAGIADRAGVPLVLVGDSLGMVMHGHDTTLPVTLDDMVRHAAAVVRGAQNALVIADLPFLTYADKPSAIAAARRLMQEAQVQAVKLEGGSPQVPTVEHLVQQGVPVMGHLGFTPQSQHTLGVRVQARQAACAKQLLKDALALEAAGAFAVVLELVPAPLAAEVTSRLRIPTIGIGAGAGCDGQVQVWHDLLGMFETSPRHAKRYAEIGAAIEAAVRAYATDVESECFPTAAQSAGMDADELAKALA